MNIEKVILHCVFNTKSLLVNCKHSSWEISLVWNFTILVVNDTCYFPYTDSSHLRKHKFSICARKNSYEPQMIFHYNFLTSLGSTLNECKQKLVVYWVMVIGSFPPQTWKTLEHQDKNSHCSSKEKVKRLHRDGSGPSKTNLLPNNKSCWTVHLREGE